MLHLHRFTRERREKMKDVEEKNTRLQQFRRRETESEKHAISRLLLTHVRQVAEATGTLALKVTAVCAASLTRVCCDCVLSHCLT